jgi:hypothetical protein
MGYWHSLYGDDLRDKFEAAQCDWAGRGAPNASLQCRKLQLEFDRLTSDVNVYNIYGTCWGTSENPSLYQSKRKGVTAQQYTPWIFTEERL